MEKKFDLSNLLKACNYDKCRVFVVNSGESVAEDLHEIGAKSELYNMLSKPDADGVEHIRANYCHVEWDFYDRDVYQIRIEYDVEEDSLHLNYDRFNLKTKYTLINILKSQSEWHHIGIAMYDNETEEIAADSWFDASETESGVWIHAFENLCDEWEVNSRHASLFKGLEEENGKTVDILDIVIDTETYKRDDEEDEWDEDSEDDEEFKDDEKKNDNDNKQTPSAFETFFEKQNTGKDHIDWEEGLIESYTINEDGKVDVVGDVFVDASDLIDGHLPFKFGKIKGRFEAEECGLTSLWGCPDEVTDYFSVSVQGPKEGIVRMLNAAIRNVGTGNVIVDDDDIDTINRKSSEENEIHGLRVAILDLLDEQCLEDSIIQEKKRDFDAKMRYHKDVLDGKVKFDSQDDEDEAMFRAEDELVNTCNGRFINLGMIHETESGLEVNMEFHLGEEESAPDWIDWSDVCRLYGCKIVIDNEEYEDGCFSHFYGTTIYEMEDGNVKETAIVPELNTYDYFSAFNKLIKANPDRYRKKKICDLEAMVRVLQAEISNETLLLQLQRLDKTNGHLDVPEGVTHLSSVMWQYANKLRSIYIPASVDTINKHAISASSLESIEISPDNPNFCSENNCILNKEKTRLLVGCKGSVVPDGIEEIEDSAFSDCCGLERIIIPSHVKKVGNSAFCGCTSLSKLIVEEGVEHLGFASFQGCTSLTDVTLPKSLEDMTDDAFKNTPWSGNVEDEDAWIYDILG